MLGELDDIGGRRSGKLVLWMFLRRRCCEEDENKYVLR